MFTYIINPHNYHPAQDREHFHYYRKFPGAMSQSIAPSGSDLVSDFYHHRLILFQEINTNTIMQKLLILVWLFSFNMPMRLTQVRHTMVFFFNFYLLPLYEYITTCSCNFPLVLFLNLEVVHIFLGSHHPISEYLLSWCPIS